jgi:hypothetical protein
MFSRPLMTAVLIGLLAAGASPAARAQQPTNTVAQPATPSGWSFNLAPYLWLPTINSTLSYNLPPALGGKASTDVSVGPGDYIPKLNFGAMVAADAQYDRFSILTDFMYMNLSASGGDTHIKSVNFPGLPSVPIERATQLSASLRLGATIWTTAGGYTVLQGDWGNLDAIVGIRYLGITARTDYKLSVMITGPRGNGATFGGTGYLSGTSNIFDGIAGVRGRIRISNTGLFIPYYFDIGAGGSNLTWQIASGLGYQMGSVGVSALYRYLSFQEPNSALVQHLSMGGPMLMVNFSF